MESTTATLPRLLKAQDVADATGESLPRIYELARKNLIPAVRLGKSIRFDAQAVARWIESGGTGLNADTETDD